MTSPDPLNANDPYDKLGAEESDTLDEIEQKKDAVFNTYRQMKREGRQNNDNQKFKRGDKGIQNITSAWKTIKKNHEPPAADEPITLAIETTNPTVYSPIEVHVTGNNGPVDTLVLVSRGDTELAREKTGSDGTMQFTPEKRGPLQFTGITTDSYDNPTESPTVNRKNTTLSFDSPSTVAEVGTKITFTVLADGTPESGVTVGLPDDTFGTTGSDGSVAHTFTSEGEYTVAGRKSKTKTAKYEDCSTPIEIIPKQINLEISLDATKYELGDETTITVTEAGSNQPVSDATVSIGSDSYPTDNNGQVSTTFTDTDITQVTAEKQDTNTKTYQSADHEIQVDKRQRGLRIDDIDGKQMEKSEVTVTVLDDQNKPLPGATVSTEGAQNQNEATDGDGEVTIKLNSSGSLKIKATKETKTEVFGTDTVVLEISAYTRELEFLSIPSIADPGDTIEVVVGDSVGGGVSGVQITVDKQIGETWMTDSNGKATIDLKNQVGSRRITAKKNGDNFNGAEIQTTVRVL